MSSDSSEKTAAAKRFLQTGTKPLETEPLPCPRCDSINTKFCYYNNYNLAQPRYFCKSCRRYWTRGGTLRNVPVGGGTRKSSVGKRSILINIINSHFHGCLCSPPNDCIITKYCSNIYNIRPFTVHQSVKKQQNHKGLWWKKPRWLHLWTLKFKKLQQEEEKHSKTHVFFVKF